MARSSESRRSRVQKNTKNAIKVASGNTAAVASGAVAEGKGTIICPASIEGVERIRTSSSEAQSTVTEAPKLRADSLSAMELNEMASKQLLAELEFSIVRSSRAPKSV